MKTLRPEDLKAYLDAAERRNALAMLYLELVSGIRKGELVALRWEDPNVGQWSFPHIPFLGYIFSPMYVTVRVLNLVPPQNKNVLQSKPPRKPSFSGCFVCRGYNPDRPLSFNPISIQRSNSES